MENEYNCFIEENVAPAEAEYIGVFSDDNAYLGKIKLDSLKTKRGEKLYSFGIVSDCHYNDYEDDSLYDNTDKFDEDMVNALSFFMNVEDVSFVCCSGDLTSDDMAHADTFKMTKERVGFDKPFFTCTGNHDNKSIYTGGGADEWMRLTYPDGHRYSDTVEFCPSNRLSYLFKVNKPNGKEDVFIFLSLDYGASGTNASQTIDNDGENYIFYPEDVLDWFEEKLVQYKNNRCFIFTHMFFRTKSGNPNKVYTDVRLPENRNYWLSGKQYDRLYSLNEEYTNTVWFTGHSHFLWECQMDDKKANVYRTSRNGGYNVHIPSLSRPLTINNQYVPSSSQAGVVDVYEDCIEIRGVDFKIKSGASDYSEYDFSKIPYLTKDDFTVNTSRPTGQTITQKADGTIVMTFNDKSGFYVKTDSFVDSSSKQVPVLKVDSVKITSNGTDVSDNGDTIGFMYKVIDSSSKVYFIEDGRDIYYDRDNGTEFNVSGNYKNGYPVTVELKAKLVFVEPEYANRFLPIAQYRLDVNG